MVLDGSVDYDEGFQMIMVGSHRGSASSWRPIMFRPEWPDGIPRQVHLDLWADDINHGHAKVLSLGARLLQEAADTDELDAFGVYADPAGHPFSCAESSRRVPPLHQAGRASLTLRSRPSRLEPLSWRTAVAASEGGISTKPNPRERPDLRSVTTVLSWTRPNGLNS